TIVSVALNPGQLRACAVFLSAPSMSIMFALVKPLTTALTFGLLIGFAVICFGFFFFSSRRRHTRFSRDWSSDVCSSDLWIRDAVARFEPERNRLITRDGRTVEYRALVVAAGIQIDWDRIPGLRESVGRDGVCSNY